VIRRSSLLNDEYMQRQIDALERPISEQLSGLLVVVTAIFLAAAGVAAVIAGTTAL
jgi:hypothetical protein